MHSNQPAAPVARRRPLVIALLTAAWVCASLCQPALAATQPDAVTPDGGHYYGALADGKLHGQGKIAWENGAWFEGEFENGLFSGKGKYQSGSGYTYEGEFKRGRMSGQGRYEMPDGSVYVGAFAYDEFHGYGRYDMAGGQVYEGEFKKGQYAGQGKINYPDGRTYTGEFSNNLYQGKGRYQTPDKQVFEGDFDKGEFSGNGVYQGKDGSRHVGTFRKWRPQDAGKFTDARGDVYEGNFTAGDLNGKGSKLGKDGSRYEGEFKSWKFHGPGVYRNADGDVYKGSFAYGTFEGEGTLTYAKQQKDGRTQDTGTWRYGTLENKEAEKQDKINVETVLYNQRSLLDKALAAIAPRAPGKINLYLLAIGGDGSQEVFRRETEFVRKQFDGNFDTQTRSMILTNSRTTTSKFPMATLTSIRASLTAIASRMDKKEDILFLFLTSHGSKTHEFTLDQNGINLRNLDAKELGKLLKESGIRWKAIVVSACYSGGFIAPLQDAHTLIITASRHDRSSFGCADENDFTYFGKAYFKESLPHSASFTAAFRKAQAKVAKWEADDFKRSGKDAGNEHSEPQMHAPPLVKAYLQKWWAQPRTTVPQVVEVEENLLDDLGDYLL